MRAPRFLGASVLIALLVPALAGAQTPDSRPGIAVFQFNNGGAYGTNAEDLAPLEVGLQELVLTELSMNTNLRVVDRVRLNEMLQEQGLAASGRVDATTAARIGRLVGARYAVTGGFIDNNGDFRMNGRIVNVETGEVLPGTSTVRGERADLFDMIVDLAAAITDQVDLPALPAEIREARKEQEIPTEAITLFSRAQVLADAGRTDGAIELYERITKDFPQMQQAKVKLQQLTGT
jgi:TolB-like protein